MHHDIKRTLDAVISDSDTGKWFIVYNSAEGFDPFTAGIRADNAQDAEEVWEEYFPDRGTGEELMIFPAKEIVGVFDLDWPV